MCCKTLFSLILVKIEIVVQNLCLKRPEFWQCFCKVSFLEDYFKNDEQQGNARNFCLEVCELYILPQTTIKYSLHFWSNFDTIADLNFTAQHFNSKWLCLEKSITFYIYFLKYSLQTLGVMCQKVLKCFPKHYVSQNIMQFKFGKA